MAEQPKPSTFNPLEAPNDVTPANDLTEVSLDDDVAVKPPAYTSPETKEAPNDQLSLDDNNDNSELKIEEKKQPINLKETKEFIGFFSSSQKSIPTPFLDPESSTSPRSSDKHKFPVVTKAELAGNWLTKHVLFVIKLPDGSEIKRRYSDFMWLRGWLTKIYQGAFIPPLPARLAIAMWPKGYLQTRKRELQVFLKRCSITPFIANEETWKMYLSSRGSSFEKARKRWDKEHSNPTIRETCEQLEKTFPNIMNEPLPNLEENALEGRYEEMKQFVSDSLQILQRVFESSKSLVDSYVNKVDSQMTMREDLWEYETLMKGRFSDESDEDKERLMKVLNKTPTPISKSLVSWCQALHEVPSQLDFYIVNNVKRNLMDFQVLHDCLAERGKILKDLYAARNKAAKWKKIEELRSKDVAQKHADELRQEELEMLSRILYKLVTKQFIYVWQASLHRSTQATKKLMVVQAKKYDQLSHVWESSIELLKDHAV